MMSWPLRASWKPACLGKFLVSALARYRGGLRVGHNAVGRCPAPRLGAVLEGSSMLRFEETPSATTSSIGAQPEPIHPSDPRLPVALARIARSVVRS